MHDRTDADARMPFFGTGRDGLAPPGQTNAASTGAARSDISGDSTAHPMLRRKPVPSSLTSSEAPAPAQSYRALQNTQKMKGATPVGAFLVWKWELVSLLICLGLVAGIFATLNRFNGKEYPRWEYSINLNSLVAIYTTALRALLLVPVAEVIGQGRWSWFARPHRLSDIEHFDRASRGAWGSARLLFLSWRPSLASVAAFVTIVSLAIGPFAQQAVRTELCDQPVLEGSSESVRVPLARSVASSGVETFFRGNYWISSNLTAAFITGLAQPSAVSNTTILDASCSTGNCTFPDLGGYTYKTMGICSRCEDATPDLFSKNLEYGVTNSTYWFLNDSSISGVYGGDLNITNQAYSSKFKIETSYTGSVNELGTSPFLKMHMIGFTKNLTSDYESWGDAVGARCSLYPCMKTFNGSFQNGYLSEELIAEDLPEDIPGDYSTYNWTMVMLPCTANETTYRELDEFTREYDFVTEVQGKEAPNVVMRNISGTIYPIPIQCAYEMPADYMAALGEAMADALQGECGSDPQNTPSTSTCMLIDYRGAIPSPRPYWLEVLLNNGTITAEHTGVAWNNMATALTNRMRNTGLERKSGDERYYLTGEAHRTAVCTRFDAYWLILPSILTVITAILLATAVARSMVRYERDPSWKSSTLPLLFHGFDKDGAGSGDGGLATKAATAPEAQGVHNEIDTSGAQLLTLRQMHHQAQNMTVRFRKEEGERVGFVDVPRDVEYLEGVRAESTTYTSKVGTEAHSYEVVDPQPARERPPPSVSPLSDDGTARYQPIGTAR